MEVRVLNKRSALLLAVLLLGAPFSPTGAQEIGFENTLSSCTTATVQTSKTKSAMVRRSVRLQKRQSISECGCTSALVSYTSFVRRDGAMKPIRKGAINMKGNEDKILNLTIENDQAKFQSLLIRLSCAGA